MKTILMATDLSARSDIGLRRAVFVACKAKASLHILHVVDCDLPLAMAEQLREGAERFIHEQVAKIDAAADIDVHVSAVFGDPCDDIAAVAADLSADLIVVGRHRPRGIAEFFTGTTVGRMARTTVVPLLVASRARDAAYDRAVVGIDFSACAVNAVSVATDLVGEGAVTLVHAYHVPFKALTMRTDRSGALSDLDREHIEAELQRDVDAWVAKAGLQKAGSVVELHEGAAIDILPQVAVKTKADLICLGAHSRSWLSTAVLGSTVTELLSYSDYDVLIAPL